MRYLLDNKVVVLLRGHLFVHNKVPLVSPNESSGQEVIDLMKVIFKEIKRLLVKSNFAISKVIYIDQDSSNREVKVTFNIGHFRFIIDDNIFDNMLIEL